MVRFSQKIGLGEEFTGPKLFQLEACLAHAPFKLCEFLWTAASYIGEDIHLSTIKHLSDVLLSHFPDGLCTEFDIVNECHFLFLYSR